MGSPEAGPSLELSAPSAVATQLNALQNNSTPRANHGLSVAYEFCGDADAFERSRYFGISKDIYQCAARGNVACTIALCSLVPRGAGLTTSCPRGRSTSRASWS